MKQATLIFAGGTVVTMDEDYRVIPDGAVVVDGHSIVALGKREAILAEYSAPEMIDCQGKTIMPGLINAHTHVPMTLLRGLADDLRLDVWLMGYIMPVEREFVNPDFCRLGTLLACAEMIRGGVTSFCDMYYFEADIAQATAEAGLRAVLCESVLKFPAPDAASYDEGLALSEQFMQAWRNHPLITMGIGPHAPYSTTPELLARCRDLARQYDVPLMIHLSETAREVEDNEREYGKSVIPYMKDTGLFDVNGVIAAHCVHVDEHEIRMLAKHNVSVAHCPSANLKLASGSAPITHMLEAGVNVAIGTDGPASNNDLDMFEEMRLVALLAKISPPDPTALPARQALTMATRNGAKALRLDAVTGSLEVGKYADIIVLDAQPMHNIPHFNFNPNAVYSQLVYAAKSADVQHTMVHGKLLMRDRVLLTIDEATIREQAARYAAEVGTFLQVRETSPLSKLIAVAVGVERGESFEVQVKAKLTSADAIEELLSHSDTEVIRAVHYRQYDTYFIFADTEQGWVRYREDDTINARGDVEKVRMRLTYTSGERERNIKDAVLLSHSRFIAPAQHPLRFYREYFQAPQERSIKKDRRRWRILFRGVLFYVNLDHMIEPEVAGLFVEIKSRTWSLADAETKAATMHEMMSILGVGVEDALPYNYLNMAETND